MRDRSVDCQYLEKRSQDILRRKPDKGYPDAGSIYIAKYYMDNYKHWDFVVTSGSSTANITEQTKASFLENELENISELNNKNGRSCSKGL